MTKIRIGQNDVKLKWFKPEYPNGVIRGYYIYFHDENDNKTEMRQTLKAGPSVDFEISNLSRFLPVDLDLFRSNLEL